MEQSLAFLQSITPVLLGVGGVCAAIAIIVAVLRYFAYEHDEQDTSPLKTRIVHVFGFIAAIGVIVGGGKGLADKIANNAMSNQIAADAGSGFLPDGVSSSTPSYDSMGDLINSYAHEEEHVSREEAGQNIENAAGSSTDDWDLDEIFENAEEIYQNGQVYNSLSGSTTAGF